MRIALLMAAASLPGCVYEENLLYRDSGSLVDTAIEDSGIYDDSDVDAELSETVLNDGGTLPADDGGITFDSGETDSATIDSGSGDASSEDASDASALDSGADDGSDAATAQLDGEGRVRAQFRSRSAEPASERSHAA